MIELIPDSPAVVLRATYVLLVRVVRAKPGDWKEETPSLAKRTVALDLELGEIYKGAPKEKPGAAVRTSVAQFELRSEWATGVPGAWSNRPLDAGVEYVAFCEGAGTAAHALEEPALLLPAAAARTDVEIVREAETKHLPLSEVVERCRKSAPAVGIVLIDWLWARHGEKALSEAKTAASSMAVLAAPKLADPVREHYVTIALDAVMSSSGVSDAFVQEFVRALFRVLAMPDAAALHENVVGTYLPTLLGLTSGLPERCAHDMFASKEEQREAEGALRAYAGPGSAKPLIAWIFATGCK